MCVAEAKGRSAKGKTKARAERAERVNLTIVAVFASECIRANDVCVWIERYIAESQRYRSVAVRCRDKEARES